MFLESDSYAPAYAYFQRAIELNPRHLAALDGLVRASVPLGRVATARDLLTRLATDPTHDEAKIALARLLASQGAFDDSARIVLGLLQQNPGNLVALEQLASVLGDAGDADRLAPVVARLRMEAPQSATTHYYAATLAYLQQRPDIAIREAEAAIAADGAHAKAQNVLGASFAGLGQRDRARAAFTRVAAIRSARSRHVFEPRHPRDGGRQLSAGPALLRRSAHARSHQRDRAARSRDRARAALTLIQIAGARSNFAARWSVS